MNGNVRITRPCGKRFLQQSPARVCATFGLVTHHSGPVGHREARPEFSNGATGFVRRWQTKRANTDHPRAPMPRNWMRETASGSACRNRRFDHSDFAGPSLFRQRPATRQAKDTPLSSIGRTLTRRPLAAEMALASAGAAGGVPGSPTPVGASDDWTICTSMAPMSPIRSGS